MTHTLTTETPYSAVMGIDEEEIPHLQSITSTYMVQWGKGLPVCILLDLKLMIHNVTYSSTFLHEATPTLPTEPHNLTKYSSSYIWLNTNTMHLHRYHTLEECAASNFNTELTKWKLCMSTYSQNTTVLSHKVVHRLCDNIVVFWPYVLIHNYTNTMGMTYLKKKHYRRKLELPYAFRTLHTDMANSSLHSISARTSNISYMESITHADAS